MIVRLSGRSNFAQLRRDGRRARAGVLWCTFVLDPSVSPPQVGFAISRAVGSAVVRNRLRRRLRALMWAQRQRLPPGRYLLGASPAAARRSFDELAFDVERLIDRLPTPPASPASNGG